MSGIMLGTMDKELYVSDQGAHNLEGEEGVGWGAGEAG